MEELTNEIRLTNAYPITDEVGSNLKPFRFKLTNTCGVGVDYNINLEVMEIENRIAAKNIAVKVDGNAKSILSNNPEATPTYQESDYTAVESYTTYSGSIKPYESVEHEVRIWLDESAGNDSQNGKFYSKVVIEARQNQVVGQNFAEIAKLGDYVEMTPTSTSYTISSSLTGYSSDQSINPSELNLWRIIKINEDGTLEMVSEYVSSNVVYFYGLIGYKNYIGALNTIAKQYENGKYTNGSRYTGYYNGQTEYLNAFCTSDPTCTEPNGGDDEPAKSVDSELINEILGNRVAYVVGTNIAANYWYGRRHFYWGNSSYQVYSGITIDIEGDFLKLSDKTRLYNTRNGEFSNSNYLRPIIILKANVLYQSGNGSLENPYSISVNE